VLDVEFVGADKLEVIFLPRVTSEPVAIHENYVIGQFAAQRLSFDYGAKTAGQEIYKKYQEWCRENGRYPMQSNRFHAQLQRVLGGKVQTSTPREGIAILGVQRPEIQVEDV
jgi:hypothetical protein